MGPTTEDAQRQRLRSLPRGAVPLRERHAIYAISYTIHTKLLLSSGQTWGNVRNLGDAAAGGSAWVKCWPPTLRDEPGIPVSGHQASFSGIVPSGGRVGGLGARLDGRQGPLPRLGGQRQYLPERRCDRDRDDFRRFDDGDAAHLVHLGHSEEARELPRWPPGEGADVPLHGERQYPASSLPPRQPDSRRIPHSSRASYTRG